MKSFLCFQSHFQSPFIYLAGEPISLHLLRYKTFAVKDPTVMSCASHLQQPRLVNYSG